MKLKADVHRSRRGQKAKRHALEHERGVGEIVDDDEMIRLREGDHLGEKIRAWRWRPLDCSDN